MICGDGRARTQDGHELAAALPTNSVAGPERHREELSRQLADVDAVTPLRAFVAAGARDAVDLDLDLSTSLPGVPRRIPLTPEDSAAIGALAEYKAIPEINATYSHKLFSSWKASMCVLD